MLARTFVRANFVLLFWNFVLSKSNFQVFLTFQRVYKIALTITLGRNHFFLI